MYQVVDFKIEPGLTLVRKQDAYTSFFSALRTGEDTYSTTNRVIELQVPESGGHTIPLARYLVGERITFRKSLTGLKLIRGLPDYSGKVDRIYLTERLPEMVKELQSRHKKRLEGIKEYPFDVIPQNNLCQEIPMYSEYQNRMEAIRLRDYQTLSAPRPQSDAEMEQMRTALMDQMRQHQALGMRDLYYTRGGTGTVTGRITGRAINRNQPSNRYSIDWSQISDFDGDTFSAALRNSRDEIRREENRRFLAEMNRMHAEATPTRYVDNRHEITAIALAEAVQAAAEVVQGERARPPASRGPRPRNQRW